MRDWGKILIRSFGIANWFFGLTGAWFLVVTEWRVHVRHLWPDPYDAGAYYFLVTINALFVLAMFPTGYWLILIRRRGVVFSNYVFCAEILFFMLSAIIEVVLGTSRNTSVASAVKSLASMGGVGNMGTVLQILTAYPVIALIALNLARRHLDRQRSWKFLQPSQA
jgi:hypothetical protein